MPIQRATDGLAAIEHWTDGYVRRHPVASLRTVGDQFVLGVRTLQHLFVDLFSRKIVGWQVYDSESADRPRSC